MARLIDADEIYELFYKQVEYGATDLMDAFEDALEDAQTVDAVEVAHGKWTPNFEYDFDRGEHRLTGYHCDQCGIWTLKKSNYCPNCGAIMDGGNEDA